MLVKSFEKARESDEDGARMEQLSSCVLYYEYVYWVG